jgi:hypothetical protein
MGSSSEIIAFVLIILAVLSIVMLQFYRARSKK